MKLIEYLVPVAHAQNVTGAKSFEFLSLFQGDFDQLLTKLVGLVLFIAALVAFAYLIFSGFQYITAGGDAAKAQVARQGIINALIGVLVIVISYVVLNYVGLNISTPGEGAGGGF